MAAAPSQGVRLPPRKSTATKPQPKATQIAGGNAQTRRCAPPRRQGTARAASVRPAARLGERHQNEGHGRRLMLAFEALDGFPALSESRSRLLSVISKDHVATADVVSAVESDVALIIAVLRLANQAPGRPRGRVDTVVGAVELLSPETVQALANRVRTFDFFERANGWDTAPERFRLHALATQHTADRLAAEVGYEHRDRLTVTSLLHDVGKLVLMHAYPGYPGQVHRGARTPEERIHQERRELGVDHALVGGVLARRWGLPATIATTIERHHNPDATGEAAFVRLADMIAHYAQGEPVVSPAEMLAPRAASASAPEELRGRDV